MARRDWLYIGVVWFAWLGAILATVAIGLAAGAYTWSLGWVEHRGLWPLYSWDYNWYVLIARTGYTPFQQGRQYAFFPMWSLLLRWAGFHWDVLLAIGLAWAASATPSG